MSDPILALAHKWLQSPAIDAGPATTFARALLSERKDRIDLERRLHEETKRRNAMSHELERLRSMLGESKQGSPSYELVVSCDEPGCPMFIGFVGAPPDEAVPEWLRNRGWGTPSEGVHRCPEHR